MSTLKERFEKALYGLLEAGDKLEKVDMKLKEAETLIRDNKVKQNTIERLLDTYEHR